VYRARLSVDGARIHCTRALRAESDLAAVVPAVRGAIDFRNVIAHEHDALSPATVWDIARNELPSLAGEVAAELARRDGATPA
jgi:uncharacterized protein with HEPN domain